MKTILVPYPIPFYSQRPDPDFKLAGFESSSDAEFWQARACGIACLKMVLDGMRRAHGLVDTPPLGTLLNEAVKSGAYCSRGWVHKGLADLATRYAVNAEAMRNAGLNCLVSELQAGHPCIASVTIRFKPNRTTPDGSALPPGGHLCVALGFVEASGRICSIVVNHPSSATRYNWERKTIPVNTFESAFSGSFISCRPVF